MPMPTSTAPSHMLLDAQRAFNWCPDAVLMYGEFMGTQEKPRKSCHRSLCSPSRRFTRIQLFLDFGASAAGIKEIGSVGYFHSSFIVIIDFADDRKRCCRKASRRPWSSRDVEDFERHLRMMFQNRVQSEVTEVTSLVPYFGRIGCWTVGFGHSLWRYRFTGETWWTTHNRHLFLLLRTSTVDGVCKKNLNTLPDGWEICMYAINLVTRHCTTLSYTGTLILLHYGASYDPVIEILPVEYRHRTIEMMRQILATPLWKHLFTQWSGNTAHSLCRKMS